MPSEGSSGRGASLVATVRSTIETRGLFGRGSSVLVACSGGPDSVAMLDALHRLVPDLGHRLVVASVDHGLRPEARDEVALVARLADERGLSFAAISLGLSEGTSMGDARRARYAALHRIAAHAGASAVAVGHTLEDQAETVLARLVRGSGLRGLRSIQPMRTDGVIRPLLDASREQVRAHLASHALPFVSDPSNRDARYLRVRLRHDVLPRLVSEDAAVAAHLAALADEANELAEYVDGLVEPWVSTQLQAEELVAAQLESVPRPFRAQAISSLVARRTGREPGRRVVEGVLDALARGGEVWLGGGLTLVGEAGRLAWKSAQRPGGFVRPRE